MLDAFKNGDTNGDPRVSNTDISIATAVIAAATIVDSLPDDFLTFEGGTPRPPSFAAGWKARCWC